MPAHSPTPLTPEALTALLHRLDPMGTGCAHNEGMEDEYASVAPDIAQRVAQGQDVSSAVMAEFDNWFWAGCLSEENRTVILEEIVAELTRR